MLSLKPWRRPRHGASIASPFEERCQKAKKQGFLAEEQLIGSPLCTWKDFCRPLLRQFDPNAKIDFESQLGYGMDGVVWRVAIDGCDFAVKVFWDNAAPEGTSLWAVQRECHNAALLQMIQTAVGKSDETIYLHPEPKTREDAIGNLYAFSDEGRRTQEFRDIPGAVQYTSIPRLRECYGWTKIRGRELHNLPRDLRPPSVVIDKVSREIRRTEEYYAIVYEFFPEEQRPLDMAIVQYQLDFYWRAGFCLAIYLKPENWKHPGVLIDMADLICPWHAGWFPSNYVRRAAKEVVGGDDREE